MATVNLNFSGEPEGLLAPGKQVGRYRIVRLIGRGGMGAVFEAVHESIGQRAAVKVLHPSFSCQPHVIMRFFNEARAVNIVSHPGLVRTYDFGQFPDGTAYIVMEYLEGESLRLRLRRAGGRLPLRDALRIARQVATALEAAHDSGIVHRDLKPDNVFLVPDPETPWGERTKVLDFGVAKIRPDPSEEDDLSMVTATGVLLGTPTYMAPEQCRGARDADGKADVYSLGIILYEMLAGRPPFVCDSVADLIALHLMEPPPALRPRAPEVPQAVEQLVLSMLAKLREGRPSMHEVAAQLGSLSSSWSESEAVPVRPTVSPEGRQAGMPSTLAQASGQLWRRWQAARSRTAMTVLAAAAMLGTVGLWWGLRRPVVQPPDPSPSAAVPAAPATVTWEIRSEPPGALVLRADDLAPLGTTPWKEMRPQGDGAEEILVRREGYAEERLVLDRRSSQRATLQLVALQAPALPARPVPPKMRLPSRRQEPRPARPLQGTGHGKIPIPILR